MSLPNPAPMTNGGSTTSCAWQGYGWGIASLREMTMKIVIKVLAYILWTVLIVFVLASFTFWALTLTPQTLKWKRVAYSCCGSNACLKQRMHTRVVVEEK